jgi:hypothetical protein
MKPTSAKQKGKDLEDWIADKIREKGMDDKACRSAGSGSGNREKADISTCVKILGKNIGIEAKNQKRLAIPEWIAQTDKLELLGYEPVLVFKLPYKPLDDARAVIRVETLLELIKWQKEDCEELSYSKASKQREKEYIVQRINDDLKKLKKLL